MPSLLDHLNNNNQASFEKASVLKHNIMIFILSSEKEKGRKKKRRVYTYFMMTQNDKNKIISKAFYLITFLLNTCIYKVLRQNMS